MPHESTSTMPAPGIESAEDIFRGWYNALQQGYDIAANRRNYKAGAFHGRISSATPPMLSLAIFISSPLTTEHQKNIFRKEADVLVDLLRMDMKTTKVEEVVCRILSLGLESTTVFEEDIKSRGEYVPPILLQTVEAGTGRIKQTTTFDNDGNVNTYEGGEYGMPPDAPANFRPHDY